MAHTTGPRNHFLERIMVDALVGYNGIVSNGGETMANSGFSDDIVIDGLPGTEKELVDLAKHKDKISTM